MAYMNMIIEAQTLAHPAKDRQPFQLSGVTEEGMEIALKIWPDNPALKVFQQDQDGFPVHYEISAESKFSDFAKADEWTLSKRAMPKLIPGDGTGPQAPPQAPHRAEPPASAPAPQKQQTTPQGVMTGAAGTKDRSITILAVMKSVIESGGTKEDFKRWLSLHDETLAEHEKKRGD
jgi:hypothetical protein